MQNLYNFVINVDDQKLDFFRHSTLEDHLHHFYRHGYDWCLQPFLRLCMHTDLAVRLSNKLQPDCINIIHSAHLHEMVGRPDNFIVCARADFPRRRWAHFHIVQNKNQVEKNAAFIPHWVQPGLIGRDSNRKSLECVGYAGQVFNGNLAATEQEWKQLFMPHGLDFVVLPPDNCFDLRDIDVLIGIRSFSSFHYNAKPASKLVNAWHAKIPFIGGFDSAFEQVGTPGQDYLRVKSKKEVLDAVLELRSNEHLYSSLVRNGVEKTKTYNDAVTLERWKEVLLGPVVDRFEKWKANKGFEAKRFAVQTALSRVEYNGKKIAKKIVSTEHLQKMKRLFEK